MKTELFEQHIKSIKILKNVAKITVSKNFFNKHKIKNSIPLDKNSKIKIKQILKMLNENTKNFISEPNLQIEILKSNKETYNLFLSKPKEKCKTEKNSNSNNFINTSNIYKNSNITDNDEIAIISKFVKLQNLKFFCKNIFQTYKQFWSISRLYKFKKSELILTIHTKKENENALASLITEFGAINEKGKFQEAVIKEYCQLILFDNAIEKIALLN